MRKTKTIPAFDLHTGDALKLFPQKIKNGTVDLAIADFPYNIGMPYNSYTDKQSDSVYLNWNRRMITCIIAALKPDGSLWLFYPDEHVSEIDVMCRREFGLVKRNHVIWGFGFGVHCTGKFSRGHAHILHYTKHKTRHTFNADAVKVPSDRQMVYKDKRAAAGGKTPSNVWVLTQAEMLKTLPPDIDLWYESRICGSFKERKKHCPNQIPLPILDRIITATSNPGDLVVDPCGGTFSTGESALRNGRRFIGFDIDKPSVAAGMIRLQSVVTRLAAPPVQPGLFDAVTAPDKTKKKGKKK